MGGKWRTERAKYSKLCPVDWATLEAIRANPGVTAEELAQIMQRGKGTVTQSIAKLRYWGELPRMRAQAVKLFAPGPRKTAMRKRKAPVQQEKTGASGQLALESEEVRQTDDRKDREDPEDPLEEYRRAAIGASDPVLNRYRKLPSPDGGE